MCVVTELGELELVTSEALLRWEFLEVFLPDQN